VSGQVPGSAARRPLLALILGATLVFVASGWYLILRAIFREARVARLQSEFVAAVSHEFRSPLTSIGHVAELLAEDRLPTDDLRRQSYQALVRDADRLRRLVENLLDFGRFDTGAATYLFERTDVARLVETVVGDFRQRVTGAGWQIELASPRERVVAEVDREAFSRALWNLLDNAVKYSPETRHVWGAVELAGGTVNIRVRDRGIGIPASELATVFQRFVRGTATRQQGIAGTGIGLAMVRQIARAHGGDVTVTSEPGVGSEFTLVLKQAEGTA
jgi:two-component system phosphate regulon sensor histidine kinase PhoR